MYPFQNMHSVYVSYYILTQINNTNITSAYESGKVA